MDAATTLFERHRPRLFGLAYRMLGTPGDAEDVLHDAWLRMHAQDLAALEDPEAWLVTVTTRLALDRLRRAKSEREHYPGPWLPEPVVPDAEHPDAMLERGESLTLSFLLLLERLSPDERAAFLLHEVFDYGHGEAAAILGIGEDACRQRVHRAPKTRCTSATAAAWPARPCIRCTAPSGWPACTCSWRAASPAPPRGSNWRRSTVRRRCCCTTATRCPRRCGSRATASASPPSTRCAIPASSNGCWLSRKRGPRRPCIEAADSDVPHPSPRSLS